MSDYKVCLIDSSNLSAFDLVLQFEGWAALDKCLLTVLTLSQSPHLLSRDSVKGQLKWQEYEPKKWDEEDVDIKILYCGICGSDLVCPHSIYYHLPGTNSPRSIRCVPAGAQSIILKLLAMRLSVLLSELETTSKTSRSV